VDRLIKRPLEIKHLKDGSGTIPEPSFLSFHDSRYSSAYFRKLFLFIKILFCQIDVT